VEILICNLDFAQCTVQNDRSRSYTRSRSVLADPEEVADELIPIIINQTPIVISNGNIGRNMYIGTSKLNSSNQVPIRPREAAIMPQMDINLGIYFDL
jgi:hypothetical protein